MYGGAPPWGSFTGSGETIAVHMTDTGTDLLVALGKFSGTDPETARPTRTRTTSISSTQGAEPVATVTGTAADLDTWLWKRDPTLHPGRDEGDRIRIEGDRITYEKLSAILGQPLN